MSKEFKHKKSDKKKATMTLKERRLKKYEKKHPKHEHPIDEIITE